MLSVWYVSVVDVFLPHGIQLTHLLDNSGFGALLGPPIAGWLIAADSGSYVHAQIFAGVMLAFGSALLVSG